MRCCSACWRSGRGSPGWREGRPPPSQRAGRLTVVAEDGGPETGEEAGRDAAQAPARVA